ncbi:ferredoxin reductase family protein [Isoptericola sediminis]|uniref:Oxidoreductase n=1 Tax=Isoptericola sediminis TaxID=2733572 RepID=A0A849JXD4_9MICO|nr:ferredoxin reductase family protein [Isoptericola sediminis]NNU27982.1 oxidoreductase [Isoptericola sediminis]
MTATTSHPGPSVPFVADRHPPRSRVRRDAAVRYVAVAALWLALLGVDWMWAADGGLQALTAWDTALTSLGQITGLASAALLLAQVLLMARVPALEAAFGRDRLVSIHRLVGLWSFNLLVAHLVLITWGYAAGSITAWPATFWELMWQYPGMLLAVGATVALVLVVVTSVRAARRRLRYESWHLLHLYGYLGAALALPHQLWTGQQFLARPAVTAVWWTVWALVFAAVLVWRVALPAWRTWRHQIQVTGVVPEAPGVVSVHLTGRRLHRLVEPGQFLVWRFLGQQGWTRGKPYSVSSAPTSRSARVTVAAVGPASTAAADLQPGTRVVVEGAYGRLTRRARTRRKVLLIGAGSGLAPLRALAEGLDYAPGEAVLIERYREHPLFAAELDHLAATRGLGVVRLPGRRRADGSWVGPGFDGDDDERVLRGWVPDVAERDVYVCGPPAWTQSVREAALAAGVPAEQLHSEDFGW